MTRTLRRVAIGMRVATGIGGIAVADDMGSVTAQATRVVSSKKVGTTASRVPIVDVSLSYGVSTKDPDLRSHAGFLALQKRVSDAADAACKQLLKQYPDSTAIGGDCAKSATETAMVKVNGLAAAAAKKPGK